VPEPSATAAPSSTAAPSGSPEASPATVPIRTFAWSRTHDGTPVGCDTIGVDDPVFGHLQGGQTLVEDDPVWLAAPDGTILHLLWPTGFVLRFEPLATLYDESGAFFGTEGDAVMLQVSRSSAEGTRADPYTAEGIVLAGTFRPDDLSSGVRFQGCYPRLP
jgi:hypothetical protein